MTHEKDFIGQLESYLDEYEGATPLPETVRDAIRAELPSTKQVRPLSGPMRYPSMFNMPMAARYGLAAAVIVAVAVLGAAVLSRGENVGNGVTPTPIPAPTATPDAESYTIADGSRRITVTLPDGWQRNAWYVSNQTTGTDLAGIQLWSAVDIVYADPCQWEGAELDPPIGPTVEDLATALANQPMRGDAVPVDVTIDGYSGQLVELTVPTDIQFADCDNGEFYSWDGRFHQGAGQHDDVYIVDVDGSRVVIDALYYDETPAAVRAEQLAIIDSIHFEP
jgi:hypothetical protein